MRIFPSVSFLGMCAFVLISSGSASSTINYLDSIRISGYGAMEMGQIVHGWYGPTALEHKWQEHFFGKLAASANTNDRTSLAFGFEIHYQYSATTAFTYIPSFFPLIDFVLDRAELNYKLFTGSAPVSLQIGYFPFKYNPQARNLGEYLFRSGCFPTFVTNVFDFPASRLLGLNVGNSLLNDNKLFSLKQNLLFTSETETYPYADFSLSYLLSMDIFKNALEFGGGISAFRFLPIDEKATTPHKDGANGTIADVDNGDTTFFSFAGTKIMARATIDPKVFIPLDIFGKEDLKIYCELAVLGLKNYPVYVDSINGIGTNPDATVRYDILRERMPFMIGFNFPAFKILDVLSVEVEYWENRYLNNRFNQVCGSTGTRYPLPTPPALGSNKLDSNSVGEVKWSIYAKKEFKNLQIVGQVGRDHRQVFAKSDPRFSDYGDNLIQAKDWYYLIKLGYGF